MTISATGSTTSGSTSTGSSKTESTSTLDKNSFLKLFTTQLKYQDPLNPMDSTAFASQLAQFSSLEQLYNVNDNLTQLISSQSSLLPLVSANLIGKTVTLQDGSSGSVTGINFDGSTTKITLDSNKTASLSNITKISN